MKITISTFHCLSRALIFLLCMGYLHDSSGKNSTCVAVNKKTMLLADVSPPQVTYTLINNTSSGTASLNATITDETGVNTTLLYYKKGIAGTYSTTTGSLTTGTTVNGTWSFSIGHSGLGTTVGDTIYYFVVAQDALGFTGSTPSGAAGSDLYNLTSYPASLNRYMMIGQISGTFLIGASQAAPNYTTITQAMNDIASKELVGDVTLLLQQNYSSAAEAAFPVTFKPFVSSNTAFTVTLKPDAGVSTVISGSNTTAIIKLANNAHHYIIDGSNSGTTSRDLVIMNTSTSTSSVVLFEGLAVNQGVKSSALKNTLIKGGSNSSTIGVLVGSATISTSSNGRGHEELLVSNNYIYNCNAAVVLCGNSSSEQVKKITVEKNVIGTDSTALYNRQYGVYATYADAVVISENKIYNLKTSASISNAGVYFNTSVTNSIIRSNVITGIYSTSSSGYGAYGINFESTGNSNDSIINNSISDVITSNYGTGTIYNAFGIRINASAANLKMYFNSVYLSGQPTTGTSASSSFAWYLASATMSGFDARNNIFSNEMTGLVSTSKHYAFRWSGAITGATFDYNVFSANSAQGVLMSNNGTDVTTIAALRTATSANANSLGIDPQFNTFNILIPKPGSPLIGAGIAIAGIGADINNALRAGSPTIGAYETPLDVSGPSIVYTRLGNSTNFISLTTSSFATITDPSTVDLSAGNKPRLYFRKHSDANVFGANNSSVSGWKWVESFSSSSPFDFTIDYSLLFGGVVNSGDSIKYFIVAQDQIGYVNAAPSAGFTGTSVAAISSAPSNPNVYLVVGQPLSGGYTIGTTGSYTSLSAAALDAALRGIQADVVFALQQDYRSTTETFPITLRPFTSSNPAFTITIQPNAGVNATISGSNSTAIIKFANNARNYIIDGSNNGTDSRNLTIINTSTSTASVVMFEGLAVTEGVKTSTLKNTMIKGGSNSSTFGIMVGAGTVSTSSAGKGHDQVLISNNYIYNCFNGIVLSGSSSTEQVKKITIEKNMVGTDSTSLLITQYGIFANNADAITIDNNRIYNIKNTGAVNTSGIYFSSGVTNSMIRANSIYGIYSTSSSGYGAYGINFESTSNSNDSIINNVIRDVITSNYGSGITYNALGIRILASTTNLKMYFNTVFLSGQPTTGTSASSSFALYLGATSMAGLDIRNNIFSNEMTGIVTTSKHYAFRWVGAISGAVFNYNVFSANSPQGILMNNNGTDVNTIATLRTATAANTNSISVDPQFNSNSIMIPKPGSPLLGAGTPIAGVGYDILRATRAATPTIGAYETAVDVSGPSVSYTKLVNSNSFSNLTTTSFATITDPSGIDVNAGTKPRLYYRKHTDANVFGANNSSVSGWKWVESNNTSSPFDFTIDYSLLSNSSVTMGDSIKYFVIAQDVIGNVGASPNTGLVASSVAAITTAPTNLNAYVIVLNPLAGSYTIGTSGSYTSITAAANDIALRGIQADVSLLLLSDYRSTSEPAFPVTFRPFTPTTPALTVTIKPDAGVDAIISGSSTTAIVKFANNARNYIIDGSNNSSASRNLMISNTSTATSSVVLFEGLANNEGVKNTVLKNTIIRGGSNANTIGVLVGSATISLSSAGKGHDQVLISNNQVYNVNSGIALSGSSATDLVKKITIQNNLLGTDSSAVYVRQYGVYATNADSVSINNNRIFNIKTTAALTNAGIYFNANVSNSKIRSNVITGIYSPNTGGYGAYGINFESTGNNNDSVTNNSISDILTSNYGTGTIYNAFGIRINAVANNLKLYFNSVSLSGQPTTGTSASSSFTFYLGATGMTGLDVRNNIFANDMTGVVNTSKHYAFRWAGAITGAVFDYNVFSANSAQGVLMNNNGTDVATIAALRTATSANANSISTDPMFNSINNLVPKPGSPVLGAGVAIAGLGFDLTNAARAATPSIGSYETGMDISGPVINYTRLTNNTNFTGLTTSAFATITDLSGVDINSGNKPRLYYKKHSDANVFGANNSSTNGWKWVESFSSSSPFDFSIDYSLLFGGSVSSGDSIRYFVVAQDVNGYVNAFPLSGFTGTSVSNVTSAPQSPDAYVVVGTPMTGTYTVGTGGTYATLTTAALDVALRGLQGDVTLEVMSNTTEPAQVVFVQWPEIGTGGYKLNIVPSLSNPAGDTIFTTASSRGVVELLGADRVTIDGRINGSGNFLTFINRATSTTQYGIRVMSLGTNTGATDNTITNVNVRLNYQTGNGARAISSEGNNNHNLRVLNCNITRTGLGIVVTATNAGTGNHNGVIISGNTIGGATTQDYVNIGGIVLVNTPEVQVTKNHIFNIIGSSYLGSYGMQLGEHTYKANISQNRIHDIINTYYYYYYYEEAGQAAGIDINSNTMSDSMLIANNVVYRLANASYSASEIIENPFGINIEGGNGHQILHNSVYLYGAPPSAAVAGTLSAALMIRSASTNLTVLNNVFANGFVGKTGSKSYAVYASATSSFAAINHNNYDTTGAGTFGRVGFKGSDALSIGAFRGLTLKDQYSVCVPSRFTSTTNLQINSGSTPTPLESGGEVLANVITDFNDDARPKTTPTTYGGNTAPDMGAYEFDGAPADVVPPVITYTPLPKITYTTSGEILQATITDGSGVDVVTATAPRLYYKNKRDANVIAGNSPADNGWKFVEASNTTSPFSFTIDYTKLYGGLVAHADTILYFVTAQDIAPIANTSANPSAGFAATSVSNITGLPTSPNFYIISAVGAMNGTYLVGAGINNSYQTITSALSDLAIRGVSGPVILSLTDAVYNSAEAFPLTIQEIIGSSAANTVTIQPGVGASPWIYGTSNQAIFKVSDRVQNFIIDGSNNGTDSRDLLIENRSTGSSASVIWFEGLTSTTGVKSAVVKNAKVKGGSKLYTIGVLIGGSTVGTSSTGAGHDQISIVNNNILNCNSAIYSNGTAASKVNNLVVSANEIGTTVDTLRNRQFGIYLKNTNRALVTSNKIYNQKTTDALNIAAIELAEGTTNAMISKNTITGIYSTSTNGYGSVGINVNSNTDLSNDSICNNMISDIMASNYSLTSTLYNAFGIRLNGGNNLKVYHNSVNLFGQPVGGTSVSASAALLIVSNGTYTNSDIRNNIFTNSMTGAISGSKHFAFWTTLSAPLANTVFNYNNFYVSGIHGILMNGNGLDINTLTDLKAATAGNANSQNVAVNYVSPTDLHLSSLSVGNTAFAGTPVASVTYDIDNNVRSTTFPYMGAHEGSIPVPVKLLSFKATLDREDVLLSWTTANETNNAGFVLERSVDNKLFEEIGFVKGAGNSKTTRNYMYTDAAAFAGKSVSNLYYRLIQVDKNGASTISGVQLVNKSAVANRVIDVYPNPFSSQVTVRIPEGAVAQSVDVLDMQGRVVVNQNIINASAPVILDLNQLDAGIYFLRVNGSENKVVKLVKTN